jgi:hypothetical protein
MAARPLLPKMRTAIPFRKETKGNSFPNLVGFRSSQGEPDRVPCLRTENKESYLVNPEAAIELLEAEVQHTKSAYKPAFLRG